MHAVPSSDSVSFSAACGSDLAVPVRRERFVLYLHGRGSEPETPPGDLVAASSWGVPLVAPHLTDDWLSQPFSRLVSEVDGWLDSAELGVGHSFGAWLLLCAAVERVERGPAIPRLCLLAPILGKGFSEKSGIGFFAPRANRVRAALGFETGSFLEPLRERVQIVHAERDGQSRVRDAVELRALGYTVTIVPGGHRLDHPGARTDVARILRSLAEP